jgi:hypothetical protein
MTDTANHIKKIQLDIWLSKSPAERLHQFLIDNDTLMQFWRNAKVQIKKPVINEHAGEQLQ